MHGSLDGVTLKYAFPENLAAAALCLHGLHVFPTGQEQ